MRERLSDYQEMYGDLYNLEATPAESTTYRLAKHDKKRWPNIKTAGNPGDTPYYTNSSHLPVDFTPDIFDALDIQDELQTLYTSGTVFHAFLGERLPSWKSAASLVKKIADNYKLPYYTLSPTYSVCAEHGYLTGEVDTCPYCGKPTEVYSRITGYYRPVQNWNKGKAQEYKDRRTYSFGSLGKNVERMGSVNARENNEIQTGAQMKLEAVEKIRAAADEGKILFTTKTCPNCKIVKDMLARKNMGYTLVDADENGDLCDAYGVMQAPTLVVLGENGTYDRYANASQIIRYINAQ
jgi:ribonucleoside-triphosphate reductase